MSNFDGGPAFPRSSVFHPQNVTNRVERGDKGMTKREVYAMAALLGSKWAEEIEGTGTQREAEDVLTHNAVWCFRMADAMLAENRRGYER